MESWTMTLFDHNEWEGRVLTPAFPMREVQAVN